MAPPRCQSAIRDQGIRPAVGACNDAIDGFTVYAVEVKGFPVVQPFAFDEERIESGLHAGEGQLTAEIKDWLAELAQWSKQFLASSDCSRMDGCEGQEGSTVQFLGKCSVLRNTPE